MASAGVKAGPPSNLTIQDPVGDAGSGPDISAASATTSADGSAITVSVTLANRTSLGDGESIQFFFRTDGGGVLNVAYFSDGESYLSVYTNGSYETIHDVPTGTWSNSTFSTTLALGDLQSAVHQPVTPELGFQAGTFTNVTTNSASDADRAPDAGYALVSTQPASATTTTTTSPPPPPARLSQKTARVGSKLEWKKLAVSGVPSGGRVSIACTKGCSRRERPAVHGGVAVSKKFVRVPFAKGSSFVVRVLTSNGLGYWFRETVNAKATAAVSTRGCVTAGGHLSACP